MLLAEVGALDAHGTNQHTGGPDKIRSSQFGTNPTYLLRRLKRDRPDLAEKVVKGEMSAHAAALAAGFRRKPTPLEQVQRAWERATEAECEEIGTWVAEQISALRRGGVA
jgi:hypothetical protein